MSVTFAIKSLPVDYEDGSTHLNLANANARALLAALGLETDEYLCGQCTVAEARRAVMRARNTNLSHLERAEERRYGAPRRREDGSVEMRPLRVLAYGLSADGLLERVARFERLVAHAAELGAAEIYWG